MRESGEGDRGRKRRRRRGRRGGRRRDHEEGREPSDEQRSGAERTDHGDEETNTAIETLAISGQSAAGEGENQPKKSRRRPRARKRGGAQDQIGKVSAPQAVDVEPIASAPKEAAPEFVAEEAPAKPKRSRRKKSEERAEEVSPVIAEEFVSPETTVATAKDKEGAGEKPKRRSRAKAAPVAPEAPVLERLAGSVASGASEFDGEGKKVHGVAAGGSEHSGLDKHR